MKAADLDRAADIASTNAYWNPRPLDREALRALLQRAFDGRSPEVTTSEMATPQISTPDRMPISD